MATSETKKHIKQLFKGYRRMNRELQLDLEAIGFKVEHTKNHIKLIYDGKLFTCPSTASDFRSGLNLASVICRAI